MIVLAGLKALLIPFGILAFLLFLMVLGAFGLVSALALIWVIRSILMLPVRIRRRLRRRRTAPAAG